MKISFNTYPHAFGTFGGGEQQLTKYYEYCVQREGKKPNLKFELFNQWAPNFNSINLMHFFSAMPSSVDFLDYIRTNKNIPIVLSPNFWPEPEGWANSNTLESIKTILWLVDRIIVNSFIELEAMVRLCKIDPSKIRVVPNAVDKTFFDVVSPDLFKEKFNINYRYILNIGNIEPRKNQLVFLKALKNFPDLKLINIGGIRQAWYFDACVSEGGGQFVHINFIGSDSVILRSALAGCEFFAMPSLCETPSIANLEAAAAGAKILTTVLGSTREYFDDYVSYVDPYSVSSIVSAIESVLTADKCKELKSHIYTKYRWEHTILDLVKVYEEFT